jgi:PAS domain S-box-containing protein
VSRTGRLRLWLGVGAAALAAGGLSLVLLLKTHQNGNQTANEILVPLIGWAFAATGLIAWSRRPENRTGRLLVAVSFAWFVGVWSSANDAALYTVGEVCGALVLAVFAHLLLAYPSGRLQPGFERGVAFAGYVVAIVANVSVLFVDPHPLCAGRCPTNLIFVGHSSTLANVFGVMTDVAAAVLLAAVAVVVVRHWRGATPAARLGLRFILPAGIAALVLVSASFAADPVSGSARDVLQTLGLLVFATLPFLFLADLLRTRLARAGVADLLLAVRETSTVTDAEEGLQRALRDPHLQLAVWLPERTSYLDAAGRPFTVPVGDSTRVATMVASEQGGHLAAIVHDVSLLDEAELLASVVAAVRLALDRDRLQTELRANLVELERERDFIRDVVNASPAFFCLLDSEGRIVRFNDAVVRATGIEDDEQVRGRPIADVLVSERDRPTVAALVFAFDPGPHEHRWTGRDGGELVVEWSLTPIEDAQGQPGVLLTGLDVSERARHEGELRSSRMRLVEAGDAERRRLERNLHDGAQQRLVALSLALRLAQSKLASDPVRADSILSEAAAELALALQELRELARGIHPAMLTDRGLYAALESLAERSPVPVELDVDLGERFAEPVEAAAFYVASEALANVAKYAHANGVTVAVTRSDGSVAITISDDGVGGADPARGSGLRGLVDRVEALGGTLQVTSPVAEGTIVHAELPLTVRETVPADIASASGTARR